MERDKGHDKVEDLEIYFWLELEVLNIRIEGIQKRKSNIASCRRIDLPSLETCITPYVTALYPPYRIHLSLKLLEVYARLTF